VSSFAKVCYCGRKALPGTARCERHPQAPRTQEERLEAQPWRKAYADPSYRRNRQLAWERSGHRCESCGLPLGPHEFISDHVIALTDGGTNDKQNLQILCAPCSKVKTRNDRRARAENVQTGIA
jgi:5-methylcytosine-specific restriction endonuclease McrA